MTCWLSGERSLPFWLFVYYFFLFSGGREGVQHCFIVYCYANVTLLARAYAPQTTPFCKIRNVQEYDVL